jgi:hypothetical protein
MAPAPPVNPEKKVLPLPPAGEGRGEGGQLGLTPHINPSLQKVEEFRGLFF